MDLLKCFHWWMIKLTQADPQTFHPAGQICLLIWLRVPSYHQPEAQSRADFHSWIFLLFRVCLHSTVVEDKRKRLSTSFSSFSTIQQNWDMFTSLGLLHAYYLLIVYCWIVQRFRGYFVQTIHFNLLDVLAVFCAFFVLVCLRNSIKLKFSKCHSYMHMSSKVSLSRWLS